MLLYSTVKYNDIQKVYNLIEHHDKLNVSSSEGIKTKIYTSFYATEESSSLISNMSLVCMYDWVNGSMHLDDKYSAQSNKRNE